ncbi:MAG: hypothetical protein ACLR43_09230 [Faecalibacillus faecis]
MDKNLSLKPQPRHIHLSKEDLETVFGEGYQLTNKKLIQLGNLYEEKL